MSSFNAEALRDIEALFGSIGPGNFQRKMDADKMVYEGTPGNGQIAPAGWVENADDVDGSATVVIDNTGITVTDGKIQVSDSGGTVLIEDGVVQSAGIKTGSIEVRHMMGDLDNLVSNPGFELDGAISGAFPTGWEGSITFPAVASECSTTTSSPQSGTYAFRITAISGASNSNVSQADITVLPNKRYRIRGWVRGQAGNNANAGARLRVHWFNAAGTELSADTHDTTVGTSTTWQELTSIVVAPSTATKASVRLVNQSSVGAAGDKVDFDAIEFYRADRDMSHASGNVVIDSTGITISNGALTFLDDFGQTVLTGAGFGATWADFIDSHVYNHSFRAGTTNNITAATIFSGADTDSDYAASLSADLPYWIVNSETGAGTFKRVADSAAVSGYALEWSGNETAEIFQDIPISPGQIYSTYLTWKRTGFDASNSSYSIIGCQFRDANHNSISGEVVVEQSLLYTTNQSSYTTQGMNWSGTAPATARYLRVFIAMSRNAGSTQVIRIAAVNVDPINVYGPQRVIGGTTVYSLGYGISWLDSSGIAKLALTGDGDTQIAALTAPFGGFAQLNANSVGAYNNVTLNSTAPGSYPQGISFMNVTSTDGWPGNGVVLTVRHADARCAQIWMASNSATNGMRMRGTTSGGGATWNAWSTIV